MQLLRNLIFCACVCYCYGRGLKVYYNVTAEEYDNVPTLFHLDDFDACMNLGNNSLYCYVMVHLKPVNPLAPSKTWKVIEEIVSVPRNFRHDWLRHGICVPKTCPKIPTAHYGVGNGTRELQRGIAAHYTELYQDFDLKGHVAKIHCEDQTSFHKVDTLDQIYAAIIGILLILLVSGTVYEVLWRYEPPEEYKRRTTESLGGKLLSSFSLVKNWEALRTVRTDEDAKLLYPIQGIRVYNTFFVVFCHTVMLMMRGPVVNTRYMEDMTLKVENMFVSNGSLICQTFFFISGWFISYGCCSVFAERKVYVSDLLMGMVYRFLRLAPLLLLVIGFNATWLRHMDRGPVWEHYQGNEFENCRNNWWSNLLFINNFYKPEKMCLQQTWYLAADTQLFAAGLILMFVVLNNRQHAYKIFGFITMSFIAIVVGYHYYLDYEIVFRSYPESMHTLFLEMEQWLTIFISTLVAVPTYVFGMACGYKFFEMKKEKGLLITNKWILIVFYIMIWILPIMTVLIAAEFYKEGYEHSRLLAALYQGINRYTFGFPIGLWILTASTGIGGTMVSVCNWSPVQVLAKIQYSIFLIHPTPSRIRAAMMRVPTYITNNKILTETIADVFLALLWATVIYVAVELPMSNLQKVLMKLDGKSKEVKEKSQ